MVASATCSTPAQPWKRHLRSLEASIAALRSPKPQWKRPDVPWNLPAHQRHNLGSVGSLHTAHGGVHAAKTVARACMVSTTFPWTLPWMPWRFPTQRWKLPGQRRHMSRQPWALPWDMFACSQARWVVFAGLVPRKSRPLPLLGHVLPSGLDVQPESLPTTGVCSIGEHRTLDNRWLAAVAGSGLAGFRRHERNARLRKRRHAHLRVATANAHHQDFRTDNDAVFGGYIGGHELLRDQAALRIPASKHPVRKPR